MREHTDRNGARADTAGRSAHTVIAPAPDTEVNTPPAIEPARAPGEGTSAPVQRDGAGKREKRIVVLGGGFGGVLAARQLERLLGNRYGVRITLVSRENFFVLTPLLFEACSGTLELRHCAQPIRPVLRRAEFIEAMVDDVDVEERTVHATASGGATYRVPYDHLVVALGASTNMELIPGSEHALTFKTMADALVLRNHLIERFERADSATDPSVRKGCLNVVVIGGGLVGVELLGELTAFADDVLRFYPRLRREDVKFHLLEAGARILPEVDEKLAAAATGVLRNRGADIRASTPVRSIEPGRVHTESETIEADSIILAAGIVPSDVAARMGVEHDRRGRIAVDATMRSRSHPEVWAIGDCAEIPGPDGRPYPALAQHATREGRHVAKNIAAAIDGRPVRPFVFRMLGTMASLGHSRAVAQILGVRVTGFVAWWVRRTYYLLQMPRWDRRLRVVLDWTVALFFRPDITKVELEVEPARLRRDRLAASTRGVGAGEGPQIRSTT